jgi:hypothetical protein
MDFGISMFENPTSIYLDNEIKGSGLHSVPAIVFGMNETEEADDIIDLESQGWARLF